MPIILTFLATLVLIGVWPVCANIYDVSDQTYMAARWAIALWVLTLDAVLWAGAIWTYIQ